MPDTVPGRALRYWWVCDQSEISAIVAVHPQNQSVVSNDVHSISTFNDSYFIGSPDEGGRQPRSTPFVILLGV